MNSRQIEKFYRYSTVIRLQSTGRSVITGTGKQETEASLWQTNINSATLFIISEKEYIQNGGNPCKIRIFAAFLCPFVAYLSLKSAFRYYTIADDTGSI